MKRLVATKREMERMLTGRRIREPISAKKRKQALVRAKDTCQYSGCKIKEGELIKLQIHHLNLKNDDNRLSNLMVLCGTHHGVMDKKSRRIVEKDILGRETKSRIIKAKPKTKKKKKKTKRTRKSSNLSPFKMPKIDLGFKLK